MRERGEKLEAEIGAGESGVCDVYVGIDGGAEGSDGNAVRAEQLCELGGGGV